MLEILRNDCFEFEGRRFRYLTASRDAAHVIELGPRTALPQRWGQHELRKAVEANGLKLIEKVLPTRPHTERLVDQGRAHARYKHVIKLIDMPGILDSQTRGPLLRKYAKENRLSKDALLDWLRKWWQGGQELAALMGDYHQCGKVTETTPGALCIRLREEGQEVTRWMSGADTPRGKKPRSVSGSKNDPPRRARYVIPEAEKLAIAAVAWEHYGADKSKSVDGAVTRVLAELYIERDADGNALYDEDGDPILRAEGKHPSKYQIYRLLTETKSLSSAYVARFGAHDYVNNIKPRVGSVMDNCNGPGDVYEVDATKLDVFVVDRDTREAIIAKPTFYLVTDRASRLIVGFHVGLDNPSWNEAKLAIMNISADWKAMAKRLGVRINNSDVIANGRFPNRFVADRGNDLLHTGSERLCDGMEIQVTNTRALHPVSKAIVESQFKGVSTPLRQFALGYEPPEDVGERRVKPHAKKSALILDKLRKVLMEIVITRNRLPVKSHKASLKGIYLRHSVSPLAIWKRGIETMTSYGSRYPYEYVRNKLMSRGEAEITAAGLKFRDCYFDSPEIREWRVRATLRKSFSVKISFEASCVNEIIVHDKQNSSKSFVATQIDKRWNNLSFAEVEDACKEERQRNLLDEERARKEKVSLYHHNDETYVEEASLTAEATRDSTFGARMTAGPAAKTQETIDRRMEVHDLHRPEGQSFAERSERARSARNAKAEAPTHSIGAPVPEEETELPEDVRDDTRPAKATHEGAPGVANGANGGKPAAAGVAKSEPASPASQPNGPADRLTVDLREAALGSNLGVSDETDDILAKLLSDVEALDLGEEEGDVDDDEADSAGTDANALGSRELEAAGNDIGREGSE